MHQTICITSQGLRPACPCLLTGAGRFVHPRIHFSSSKQFRLKTIGKRALQLPQVLADVHEHHVCDHLRKGMLVLVHRSSSICAHDQHKFVEVPGSPAAASGDGYSMLQVRVRARPGAVAGPSPTLPPFAPVSHSLT